MSSTYFSPSGERGRTFTRVSTGSGSTLVISGPTPEDLSDPTSANHDHGAAPPVAGHPLPLRRLDADRRNARCIRRHHRDFGDGR